LAIPIYFRAEQEVKMEEKRSSRDMVDEDDLEDTENIIINEVDGLPNLHPNYEQLELKFEGETEDDANIRSIDELVHDEDLPTSVIVTNVDPRVFKCDDLKVIFILYNIHILRSNRIPVSHCAMLCLYRWP
jgi:hypothetical protein